MKAFRFRLESLLNLRTLHRERRLKEYAHAINERQRQEELLGVLSARLAKIESDVAERRAHGISGHDQDIFLASIDHANAALERQREVIQTALAEEERTKATYIEADIAEKTLLRLKERRSEEHLREQESKEEGALEDVIGARYGITLPTELYHETA